MFRKIIEAEPDLGFFDCPHCGVAMETYERIARGTRTQLANMCFQCGGVWFAGGDVRDAFPALDDLRVVLSSLPLVEDGAALPCPNCDNAELRAFRFLDVELDGCGQCYGLWVDGDELSALTRDSDRSAEERGLHEAPRGYRDSARKVAYSGLVTCRRCNRTSPLEKSMLGSAGPICAACVEEEAAEAEPEPSVPMDGLGAAVRRLGDIVRDLVGAKR